MYNNGITIWHKTGEDVTFRATYVRFNVDEVHLESTHSHKRVKQGETSTDKYVIISPVDAFLEGDFVADGKYVCDEPVEDSMRVTSVAKYQLHGSLHHVEVTLS